MHRGDDCHPTPRPCHRHIQPSLASLAVEWTETHGNAPRLVGSVADPEENDIALVTLHILQVLDEERIVSAIAEELLQVWVRLPQLLQFVQDAYLLPLAEGNHPEALFRM